MAATEWRLELVTGDARPDRPASFTLRDGLTLGRGNADLLLDSTRFGGLLSRVHARFHLAPGQPPLVENLGLNRTRVGETDLDKGGRAPLAAGVELVFGVGIPNGRPLHTCAWRDEFRYRVVVVSAFANE